MRMNLSDKRETILAGVIISLSTLIAYWNVQFNNLVCYDDIKYLIENEYVKNGLSLDSIAWALTATYDDNWFPLTWLSHMLDMTLFGSNPLGHHLENLFLHIVNAVLIMCILLRLTGHIWRSTAVALLFALHPLHVESVAWAAERKDVLSTLFFLLAIKAYITYTTRQTSAPYWTAIFLYLCGLASKPMLVSLPLVLLLMDFWPLRRHLPGDINAGSQSVSSLLREKLPFMILSAASCLTTFLIHKNGEDAADMAAQSIAENVPHALFNYATYLRRFFWPDGLGVLYPYVPELPLGVTIGVTALILGLSLLAFSVRRKKPYVMTGWLWFLITMAPVAGFVRIGVHSIADRYTYIPSIGIFIVAVWFLSDILAAQHNGKIFAVLIAVAFMVPLTAVTWKQTTYWKDSITLFEHNLAVTRDNWIAEGNLGAELLRKNLTRQALGHLQEAVRINPDSYIALFNIGLILKKQGDLLGSISAFRKTIRLNPKFVGAYFEAGKACYEVGYMNTAYDILADLARVNRDMANDLRRCYAILSHMRHTDS